MSLNRMSDYVGYMMQEPHNQIISLEVHEDIAFGLGNMEISLKQIDQRVNNALTRDGGLGRIRVDIPLEGRNKAVDLQAKWTGDVV